ncbi:MAG: hypothetical protein ACYC2U_05130 [Candidatus Amoebophilus sp.]
MAAASIIAKVYRDAYM